MTQRSNRPPPWASLAIGAAVAGLYFAAGKGGLALAFVHASASAVWPPTGIALAAFLVLGCRFWPAVLLGAFLVNITTAGTVATSLGIAIGNTLECLAGALLVNRFAGGRHALNRAADLLRYTVLAGLLATMISPSVGVTCLALGGFADWSRFGDIWVTWWLGDAAGAIIVAPMLLAWIATPAPRWSPARIGEAALMLASIAAVGLVVFSTSLPLTYLCTAVLVWPAFRFGPRETATAIFVLAGIANWATLTGRGPFVASDPNVSLVLLQAFMGVKAVVMLALTALVSERSHAVGRLRAAHADLEDRIRERTAELTRANAELLQAQQRAVQAERLAAIGQMEAGLAHESRNALQQIQAAVELLAPRVTERPEARFVAEIQRAEERLHRLFEDVRGYAAPLRLECRKQHLPALWREAWDQTRPLRQEREARLEEVTDGVDLACWVDPFCVERVFHNILVNALGACPAAGPARIEVCCSEADLDGRGAVRVTIRDNGPGFTAEQHGRIFEPFYTTKTRGTGLGMAISKRIVEAHGGRITARNGAGAGAEIEVVLPRESR